MSKPNSKPRKLEYFYDVLSPYLWIGFEVVRCHLLAKQKRYLFCGSVQSQMVTDEVRPCGPIDHAYQVGNAVLCATMCATMLILFYFFVI